MCNYWNGWQRWRAEIKLSKYVAREWGNQEMEVKLEEEEAEEEEEEEEEEKEEEEEEETSMKSHSWRRRVKIRLPHWICWSIYHILDIKYVLFCT